MNYNTTHPEIHKGEMFLSNMNEEAFQKVRWNTKRSGVGVYDVRGNTIKYSDMFPVFVQKEEYDNGMKVLHKEQKQ